MVYIEANRQTGNQEVLPPWKMHFNPIALRGPELYNFGLSEYNRVKRLNKT